MVTQFAGEHLLPGKIGQAFTVLGFGASTLAALSYYFSVKEPERLRSWKTMARVSFVVQALSVFGIMATIFYIISHYFFEYHYAWEHSSRDLPAYFRIAGFWEGQEGSFLLWGSWQSVLGFVLMITAKKWESPVMAVVCLSQMFICSMLLGVDILGQQIGSSPFILTRSVMEGAPIFKDPQYLSKFLTDGRGLNPLLQNYWMVIHPPVLFLGFASMIIPFGYAISGLWLKKYKAWVTPAIPWALGAIMVLGTGILMGSAWAYEALNFGGAWQWDPVENASIIPWLILVGALHVMVSFKATGSSYLTATILVLASYVLVLYASFLTRSGVLQNASVHAFTDLGMMAQLIAFCVVFAAIATGLLARNWKTLPRSDREESVYSREFWMFIGAMVLTLSCFQIIATTSIPVVNAIFGSKLAPPVDVAAHYNKWQAPFAILITSLSAFSQILKYKKTDPIRFFIQLGVYVVVSVIITFLVATITHTYHQTVYVLLVFSCAFSIVSNTYVFGQAIKGRFRLAGSAIAHIGFAMLLLGALVAFSNRSVISVNEASTKYGPEWTEKNEKENILLYKAQPYRMGKYLVTYLSDSTSGPNTYYKVNYTEPGPDGKPKASFDLFPNAQVNEKMGGLIASPSTKHYFLYDIYTHVSEVPGREDVEKRNNDSTFTSTSYKVKLGDTLRFPSGFVVVRDLNRNVQLQHISLNPSKNEMAVGLQVQAVSAGKTFSAQPVFLLKNGAIYDIPAMIDPLGLKFRFVNILPSENRFEIVFMQKKAQDRDWIIMKAMIFPWINFLWIGGVVMMIGFLFSIFRRTNEIKPA